MYQFFAYISRMKYINRWSLMRSSVPENIQEHSHMVAVLAHALGVIRRDVFGRPCSPDACAAAALFHDATEDVAAHRLLSMLPDELRPAYRPLLEEEDPQVRAIVKAADKLSAYIKCLEELEAGNNEFADAAGETLEALRAMELPEAAWFLDHFSEAFGLTLDGLQRM